MSKKEILIEQMKQFDNKYFNEDQKTIAINILKNAPEKEVQAYADFLFNKKRTGFTFDYSPEIAKGRLITLREDKVKRINVDDDINKDENKLIIGDNYNALKALLITHKEKIDVIYIDPPYNTEKAKDEGNNDSYKEGKSSKFIYKDKFGRKGWLNMMKDRLTLAKDLLKDDGVIFVSIDDNEQAYLKVLMDDIFGEEHFIACLIWEKCFAPKNNSLQFSVRHDYILVYSKNLNFNIQRLPKDEKQLERYVNKDNDERGLWISDNITVINSNNNYPVFNKKIKSEVIPMKGRGWGISKEKFLELDSDNRIYWPSYGSGVPRLKRFLSEVQEGRVPETILFHNKVGHNQEGTQELKSILNKLNFNSPKPTRLIKYLINRNKNKNAIVLDFFSGSGTTAQAVMDLNREDGGNRKFILVTNNENNIAHNVTYERMLRIIKGIGTKNEKDFDWLKKNKPYDNVNLRVVNIDDNVKISLDQDDIDEKIFNDCKNGLKLLDNEYNKKDLNLYYDLSALNPIEKIEE